MINFEEELKHFRPIAEVEEAEDEINKSDITDITDIIAELMKNQRDSQKQ